MSEIVSPTVARLQRPVVPFWGIVMAVFAITLLYLIVSKIYMPVFSLDDWADRASTWNRRHILMIPLLGVSAALILFIESIHVARWERRHQCPNAMSIFEYFGEKPRRNLMIAVAIIAWSSQALFYASIFADHVGIWKIIYSVTSIKVYAGFLIGTPIQMLVPDDRLLTAFLMETLAGMFHWFLLLLPVAVLAQRGHYRYAKFTLLAVLLGHIAWGLFLPQPIRLIW